MSFAAHVFLDDGRPCRCYRTFVLVWCMRGMLQGILCFDSSLGLRAVPTLKNGQEGFLGPWFIAWGFNTNNMSERERVGATGVAGVLVVDAEDSSEGDEEGETDGLGGENFLLPLAFLFFWAFLGSVFGGFSCLV
ncbi:hypothetical protein SUGI_0354490 [Cryptomeria japonica]|nr:hypothetical protein SUGI_0354490 [Cryptomeria japonica]